MPPPGGLHPVGGICLQGGMPGVGGSASRQGWTDPALDTSRYGQRVGGMHPYWNVYLFFFFFRFFLSIFSYFRSSF